MYQSNGPTFSSSPLPTDLRQAFVAAMFGRWYVVINEDIVSNDGTPSHRSRVLGSSKGYPTYHDGAQALYELRHAVPR